MENDIFFETEIIGKDLFILYWCVENTKKIEKLINPSCKQILELFKSHPVSPYMWLASTRDIGALSEYMRKAFIKEACELLNDTLVEVQE